MSILLAGTIGLGLFFLFCSRNYFIFLMAIKLLTDSFCLVFIVYQNQNTAPEHQAVAWYILTLGLLLLFLSLGAGVRIFKDKFSLSFGDGHE